VFATKWKLTALAAAAAVVAAGATIAVAAAAQPAGPRHAAPPTFAPVERAMELVKRAVARRNPRSSGDNGAASPESFGVSKATLDAIAQCESGGDPTALSAGGTYRGLYQFDETTWQSVGGAGDPAAASPAE
jgi:soluble lytic murein transglycosylase-like protein